MRTKSDNQQKGYLILEVMIATIIFTSLVLSLFSMIGFLQRRAVKSRYDSEASLLVQEGMEVAYNNLLSDWGAYREGTKYHPVFDVDMGVWFLVEGEDVGLNARFDRHIEIKYVCRAGGSGEMVDRGPTGTCEGGEIDENSKYVVTKLNWEESGIEKEVEAELLTFKVPE